ncbi:hypothetical protein GOP47_0018118 [Adiantum capillus-veneris]|uniref:Uncharacterized protein n=1 Tax=Adiantum capillus-veneris TaxID=13818 RepID=A0A9D4UGX4_ADICA|nr:hypothetical protein GOP47_0018118 [Adiantum capillus-veneris]
MEEITEGLLSEQRHAPVLSSFRRSACYNLHVAMLCCAFLLSLISSGCQHHAAAWTGEQMMSPDEAQAVYEVLEAVNNDVAWRQLYGAPPGAEDEINLCLEGPHGLVCGADEHNVLHVVELNLGWLSDATNNPRCGPNASFSPALTRFPYLRKLFFYNCFSHSATKLMLPPFLWALGSSLEELVFLRNSMLVGGLPENIANLVNLKRLIWVGNNALQGTIPEKLGELMMLEQLVLSRNRHTGGIPKTLGSLRKLRVLDLSWNSLEGSIPIGLASAMAELQKLDLSHNELSGSIPLSVGEAFSLELLDLSWNKLSGPLPDGAWVNLRYLRVLEMGHNTFNGSVLPKRMWGCMWKLIDVGMAEAGLTGPIPEAMGQMKSLRYLDLSGNGLEGEVPASLEQGLPSIFEMDFSGNRLQGMLPFSAEFVERMGQNLRVGGNDGLCRSNYVLNVSSSAPSTHQNPSSATLLTRGEPHASLLLPVCKTHLDHDEQFQHHDNQPSPVRHAAALIYINSRSSSCLCPLLLQIISMNSCVLLILTRIDPLF